MPSISEYRLSFKAICFEASLTFVIFTIHSMIIVFTQCDRNKEVSQIIYYIEKILFVEICLFYLLSSCASDKKSFSLLNVIQSIGEERVGGQGNTPYCRTMLCVQVRARLAECLEIQTTARHVALPFKS